MTAVLFTTTATGTDPIDEAARSVVADCRAALARSSSRFEVTDDPSRADHIVFAEPPRHKFREYGDVLADNPLIRQWADKVFAYDWADGPAAFLPGVYPSLTRAQWDPTRQVGGGFLLPYNSFELVKGEDLVWPNVDEPPFLMTFRGANSNPVRQKLMLESTVGANPQVDYSISTEWFTHSSEQKANHHERIESGKFALCPRGVGPSTFRVYEAMALGRAPVIVSDDWVPPAGPDWSAFSLVLAESRPHAVHSAVAEREDEWRQMGVAARVAWEDHFAPATSVLGMLEAVDGISKARGQGEDLSELKKRWSSNRFKGANDWRIDQRLARVPRRLSERFARS